MNNETNYKCPLCEGRMVKYMGDSIDSSNGVLLRCESVRCDDHCHENVYGHGSNEKNAYEIACQKYQKR